MADRPKTEQEAKNILDALHDYYEESIFVTDGEGKVLFANKVAAARLNTTCEELEGHNVRELVDDGMYQYSTTLEAIETGMPVVHSLSEDPEDISFSNSVPVRDEHGRIKYVVTNNMNPTHNKAWDSIMSKYFKENDRLQREMDYLHLQDQRTVIANSPGMKNVIRMVETLGPTDSSVIIMGESGTGKDVIAQLIHEKSLRKDHPYISINCAAIPESLLESEMFGYEPGAFTGAKPKGKIGLFEAASGGSIFLDEIGEMPPALQSRLLRVLENHEIRRVGGVENIPVDVRVICATNSDLPQMVKDKKFRQDLYYRLSVFTIQLPPLRERKEDILPIAEMFLKELNNKYGTDKVLSEVTKQTILGYNWPGNIRELRNVVERTFFISQNNELVFTPVPTAYYGPEGGTDAISAAYGYEYGSLKEFVTQAERSYIKKVLDECGGSVRKAADRLGVHRSVLYRKLHDK
ncbi:MAG: sigma-54 interaction domain-containing protein [Eubacterium sp.]|jgi:transcriptional regulator with PAS, ATPase and Fis domain